MLGNGLLILSATVLALMTAAAQFARYWWAFDLLSHFRLQYVVVGAVLCVAALVCRSYAPAIVLGFVAGVHAWAIRDIWLGGSEAVAGVPVRVITANVLNSNPTPAKVLEFVETSRPDVVLLIEAQQERWRESLERLAEDYQYRAPADWRNGAAVILFSRLRSWRRPKRSWPSELDRIS